MNQPKLNKRTVPMVRATQFDVALRQLDTAIRLFFAEDDEFSIHSLVRNAEEIISQLLKERGQKSLWTYILDDRLKPEYREPVRKEIDGVRNSLKHRVHKEDEIIEMPVATNENFLFVCVHALHLHWPDRFKSNHNFGIYNFWFRKMYPDINPPELQEKIIAQGFAFADDIQLSKSAFYEKYVRLLSEPAPV